MVRTASRWKSGAAHPDSTESSCCSGASYAAQTATCHGATRIVRVRISVHLTRSFFEASGHLVHPPALLISCPVVINIAARMLAHASIVFTCI